MQKSSFEAVKTPLLSFLNRSAGKFINNEGESSPEFWSRDMGRKLLVSGLSQGMISIAEAAVLEKGMVETPMFETANEMFQAIERTPIQRNQVSPDITIERCCEDCAVHGWYPRAVVSMYHEQKHVETLAELIQLLNRMLVMGVINVDTTLSLLQQAQSMKLSRTETELREHFTALPLEKQIQVVTALVENSDELMDFLSEILPKNTGSEKKPANDKYLN